MNIRPAIPQDAFAIAHVHVATWQATYVGIVPQPYLDSLDRREFTTRWTERLEADTSIAISVAETDAGIIGFASGGPIRKAVAGCDAELYAIYLLPEKHHQGIGQSLVAHIEQHLIQQHRKHILAWVLSANPATAFYAHLGGTVVAEDTVDIGGVTLPELAYAWPIRPRT